MAIIFKRMDTYMQTLVLLCASITLISAAFSCPEESTYVYYANQCCEPFAPFAFRTPTLREVCKAYKASKPCMTHLLEECPTSARFKKSAVYIYWFQVAEVEVYCWY